MNPTPASPTLSEADREKIWPPLPFSEWQSTAETLHMWTQIVGKVRLALTPWINHSWHVTLYLTARGLTTSPIPHGFDTFEIRFDFISHELRILKSDGAVRVLPLRSQSVAAFYREVMGALEQLALSVKIDRMPNEIAEPIAFDEDETHCAYVPEQAHRFWQVLRQSDRVLKKFRSRFCGKCSPVHFFWGSFDLAVTRFSGRPRRRIQVVSRICPTRNARSLRAGSEQRGLLARQRFEPNTGLLFLRLSRTAGICRGQSATARGRLLRAAARIHFALRRGAQRGSHRTMLLLTFAQSVYDAASTLGKWDRESARRSHAQTAGGVALNCSS